MALFHSFTTLMNRYSDDKEMIANYWNEIQNQYSQSSRYYHNLSHLENMLNEFNDVQHLIQDHDSILFAIFYHDIVYKSTSNQNEYKSALIFKERIAKTSFSHIDKVFHYIEATQKHLKSDDSDLNHFLDIDITILGQPQPIYEEYCQNIRKEYSIYPDFMYNRGRKKVIQHFINKPAIFHSPHFIDKYEEKARENLSKEQKIL